MNLPNVEICKRIGHEFPNSEFILAETTGSLTPVVLPRSTKPDESWEFIANFPTCEELGEWLWGHGFEVRRIQKGFMLCQVRVGVLDEFISPISADSETEARALAVDHVLKMEEKKEFDLESAKRSMSSRFEAVRGKPDCLIKKNERGEMNIQEAARILGESGLFKSWKRLILHKNGDICVYDSPTKSKGKYNVPGNDLGPYLSADQAAKLLGKMGLQVIAVEGRYESGKMIEHLDTTLSWDTQHYIKGVPPGNLTDALNIAVAMQVRDNRNLVEEARNGMDQR